jgi:hypothetical protein
MSLPLNEFVLSYLKICLVHLDTSSVETEKRYTPALAYKQDYINLDTRGKEISGPISQT